MPELKSDSVRGSGKRSDLKRSRPPGFFASLDLARGCMALFVLVSHSALHVGAIGNVPWVFKMGGTAVDVFMFISGFLMMWHYREREVIEPWNKPSTWKRFWLRRFFRIAPLYWLMLSLAFLLQPTLMEWSAELHDRFPRPWADDLIRPERIDRDLGVGNILSHYLFVFGFIPQWSSNNLLPDWSIGLEMQFYFAFPFIAVLVARHWLVGVVLLLAVWQVVIAKVSVGITTESGPWGWFPMATFLPLRLGIFVSGMLVAEGLRQGRFSTKFLFLSGSILTAILHSKLLAAFVLVFVSWELLSSSGRLSQIVRAGNWVLQSKPSKFLADCSYGVYLCHGLIQIVTLHFLLHCTDFAEMDVMARFYICLAISLPFSLIVAWVLFRMVEKPGIVLGKRVLTGSVR